MSSGETDYSASGLLKQLTTWREQSLEMSSLSQQAQSSAITGVDTGVFADAVSAYNQCVQEMQRLLSQGATQMQAISAALGVAAKRYGANEQQIAAASAAALTCPADSTGPGTGGN
jgi:hypothetical protein